MVVECETHTIGEDIEKRPSFVMCLAFPRCFAVAKKKTN